MFILFFFPPLPGLFPPFLSFFLLCVFVRPCACVCVCVCVCVYAHSVAHLNLLLITSHTSRLSEGLLTVEDYQPEPFNPFSALPAPTRRLINAPIMSPSKKRCNVQFFSSHLLQQKDPRLPWHNAPTGSQRTNALQLQSL